MPTDEEIKRRVTTDDTPITAHRIAIAQKVNELGTRISVVAAELQNLIEQVRQEIGDSHEIITVEKLAIYTDIPKANLNEWLSGYKAVGTKRKRSSAADSGSQRPPTTNKTNQPVTPGDRILMGPPVTAKHHTSAGTPEHE